jgi:hypothetical protein
MAVLKATRTSQDLLCAEFIFNYNDTATDSVAGTSKTFGSVYTDAIVLDAINLPVGAEIVGGHLVVEAQGVGPTAYTVALGVAGNTACYLAATSLLTAANTRTALLLTSALASTDGSPVRLTIASTVANATAGKFRITVLYKKDGRGGREVNPA